MEKKIEYVLRKTSDNPFDKSFKECFTLFVKDKDEPYALLYTLPKWLKESSLKEHVFSQDDIKISSTSKKSKHLQIGDPIHFSKDHDYYIGILDQIIDNEDDYWDDTFVIKSCEIRDHSLRSKEWFLKNGIKQPDETVRHLRRDCSPIDWRTVELKCPCCGKFD